MALNDGNLRPMNEADLAMALAWRNSDRVRLNMFSDQVISPEEHRNWFDHLNLDENTYLIFEYRGKPVGLSDFKDIDKVCKVCIWGFYLGEPDLPPGTGLIMGYLSMEYAFKVLSMEKLCSQVLAFNQRSIKYHKKLGFQEEKYLEKHIMRNGIYEDVVAMKLFNVEWEERKVFLNQI